MRLIISENILYKLYIFNQLYCYKLIVSFFQNINNQLKRNQMEDNFEDASCSKKSFSTFKKDTFDNNSDESVMEYCCSICSFKSKEKSVMTTHIQIHSGVKPFQCRICQMSFDSLTGLIKHKRIHTSNEPNKRVHTKVKLYKRFKCNLCNSSFITNQDLKRHLSIHAEGKSYKCLFCNLTFIKKLDLKRHSLTHSNSPCIFP